MFSDITGHRFPNHHVRIPWLQFLHPERAFLLRNARRQCDNGQCCQQTSASTCPVLLNSLTLISMVPFTGVRCFPA